MTVDPDTQYVLAIDLGTTGLKLGLVSLGGTVAWTYVAELTTIHIEGGGAEQDADLWWDLICTATRKGLQSGVVDPAAVVAVSVTGQWSSTVPVDESGVPVGPCILWMDTRGGRYTRERLGGRVAGYGPRQLTTWIRRTGAAPSTSGVDPIGHMLHLDTDRADIARRARWYLEPVDYLGMRFTGQALATPASMTGVWLTDNRKLGAVAYDPTLIKMAGVDATKLPPLRPTASVLGTVQPSVAADLGLGADVKVVAGTPDLHSGSVGAGAIGDYECHMAIGTTSWISCPVDFKKTDLSTQVASVPGPSPDRYIVINNHDTSGACFQWVRDLVFAPTEPRPSFASLSDEATGVAAGSGGIIFTPWLTGERSPVDDRNARAGWHNVSITSGRAAMIRAVLEGVAYNDRWLLEAVEKFVKRKLDPIRVFGGGAQSDLWCQIHADVMDRTLERPVDTRNTGLRGAALLAGLALGAVQRSEVRARVGVEKTFRPDPANRAVYDRMYEEFPKLYAGQKAMFKRLNRSKRS